MNTESSRQKGDPLDDFLRAWNVDTPLPPRFQERVWGRISREEAKQASGISGWWVALASLIARVLRQPVGATAYLSAFLLTGAALGYWGSEHYGQQTEAAWRTAYLNSVTPTLVWQSSP